MKPVSPFRQLVRWTEALRAHKQASQPPAIGATSSGEVQANRVLAGPQSVLEQPLLVFDLETSGLDLQRDTVLSIGAVRIEHNAIPLTGHLDHVLQTDISLKADSQLLHGLSREDLQQGMAPAEALRHLLDYGAGCIWLAFHAGFDQRMLDRALRHHLNICFRQTLFDVATLAPMLFPEFHTPAASLDHWAECLNVGTCARHSAAADAMLTAEITLILLHQAQRQGLHTWQQLASATQRWRQIQDSSPGPLF